MAWYSYTLAIPVETENAKTVTPDSLSSHYFEGIHYVTTSSRNGAMLGILEQIHSHYAPQTEFYLLQDFALLEGPQIALAISTVSTLLDSIAQNPEVVSEATKSRYTPYIILESKEFEPLQAELVYPSDALIRDGFYYQYPPEKVRQALEQAIASNLPELPYDPDGESLEYVFCLLKSHLWLLQSIDSSQQSLVYGELNT